MAQKSRELDKKLAEIITPLGFKRVPKTRYFIRLCGDGVLQGVHWYHEPRYEMQELEICISSIYSDPDYLFRPNLLAKPDRAPFIMSGEIPCCSRIYGENEYIPTSKYGCFQNEDEELAYFQKQILPRLERWKTQENVFYARHGSTVYKESDGSFTDMWYKYGVDINLAMYLNLPDEVDKFLDASIPFYNDHEKKDLYIRKRDYFRQGDNWVMNDISRDYLRRCREQNLFDYDRIMRGERGQMLYDYDMIAKLPFFQIVSDNKSIPVQWESDLEFDKKTFLKVLVSIAKINMKYRKRLSNVEITEDDEKELMDFDYLSIEDYDSIVQVFNGRLLDLLSRKGKKINKIPWD